MCWHCLADVKYADFSENSTWLPLGVLEIPSPQQLLQRPPEIKPLSVSKRPDGCFLPLQPEREHDKSPVAFEHVLAAEFGIPLTSLALLELCSHSMGVCPQGVLSAMKGMPAVSSFLNRSY